VVKEEEEEGESEGVFGAEEEEDVGVEGAEFEREEEVCWASLHALLNASTHACRSASDGAIKIHFCFTTPTSNAN